MCRPILLNRCASNLLGGISHRKIGTGFIHRVRFVHIIQFEIITCGWHCCFSCTTIITIEVHNNCSQWNFLIYYRQFGSSNQIPYFINLNKIPCSGQIGVGVVVCDKMLSFEGEQVIEGLLFSFVRVSSIFLNAVRKSLFRMIIMGSKKTDIKNISVTKKWTPKGMRKNKQMLIGLNKRNVYCGILVNKLVRKRSTRVQNALVSFECLSALAIGCKTTTPADTLTVTWPRTLMAFFNRYPR